MSTATKKTSKGSAHKPAEQLYDTNETIATVPVIDYVHPNNSLLTSSLINPAIKSHLKARDIEPQPRALVNNKKPGSVAASSTNHEAASAQRIPIRNVVPASRNPAPQPVREAEQLQGADLFWNNIGTYRGWGIVTHRGPITVASVEGFYNNIASKTNFGTYLRAAMIEFCETCVEFDKTRPNDAGGLSFIALDVCQKRALAFFVVMMGRAFYNNMLQDPSYVYNLQAVGDVQHFDNTVDKFPIIGALFVPDGPHISNKAEIDQLVGC